MHVCSVVALDYSLATRVEILKEQTSYNDEISLFIRHDTFLELYHTLPIAILNPKIQNKHGKVDPAANKTCLMTNVDPISRLRARVIAKKQFYYQNQNNHLAFIIRRCWFVVWDAIVVGDKIVNSLSFCAHTHKYTTRKKATKASCHV